MNHQRIAGGAGRLGQRVERMAQQLVKRAGGDIDVGRAIDQFRHRQRLGHAGDVVMQRRPRIQRLRVGDDEQ